MKDLTHPTHPGFKRVAEKDYHNGPGLSKSDISRILISPAHYKTPKKESKAMVQGSAFHTAVLEPEEFSSRFMVLPDGTTRVHKEGKAMVIQAAQEGKDLISREDADNIQMMAAAIWVHPQAKEILEGSEHEISGYWYDSIYPNLLCKMRIDVLSTGKGILADIKTTEDARSGRFQNLAFNMGYHIQAGWYCEGASLITGVPHNDFYFIVVEREAPYGVNVYKADPELMVHGLREARGAVDTYIKCLEKDEWPCYPPDLLTLKLPGWVRRKEVTQIIE